MGRDGEEQNLVIGLGITKQGELVASYSHLRDGFGGWVCDADRAVPSHLQWFAKCWDQVLVEVLIHGKYKFVLAAHECFGRDNAKQMLEKLRDELLLPLTSAAEQQGSLTGKLSRRLKAIASGPRGIVPPRKVLVLYPGAPKKFLTKEEQAPEFLEEGKSRLQQELEEFDTDTSGEADEDAFVFNVDSARRAQSQRKMDDNEESFTFTLPPQVSVLPQNRHLLLQQQRSRQRQPQLPRRSLKPAHHRKVTSGFPHSFINLGPRGPASPRAAKAPAVKLASPSISGDFTRSGARVSPEDHDASKKQLPASGHFASALHTGFGSFASRGKQLFSMQFERNSGGRTQAPPASKLQGSVGQMAPSGLSWEDEIAAQLAAAGVRVSGPDDVARGRDDKARVLPSLARARTMLMPRTGAGSSVAEAGSPAGRSASPWRQLERGSGIGRFAKGLRRSFNRQEEM